MNSWRSTFRPSSKGSSEASTHLMLASGALKPRNLRALALRKAANTSGEPPATSRSRTFFSGIFSSSTLRAKATAPSSSLPSSARLSTRPMARHSLAGTCAPLVIISSAFSAPTMRGSRWVPPAPGSSPRFTSGRPHLAEGTATR